MQSEHPLTAYRRAEGLSQARLAEAAGTTKSTLSRIEAGLQKPSFDLLGRIVAACRGAVSADAVLAAVPGEGR